MLTFETFKHLWRPAIVLCCHDRRCYGRRCCRRSLYRDAIAILAHFSHEL